MGIDKLSPSQLIRMTALENAVNQLPPNDTVESVLSVAKQFEEYIATGKTPTDADVIPIPIPRPPTANKISRLYNAT